MSHWIWDAAIIALLTINLTLIVFLIKKAWYGTATVLMLTFGLVIYGSVVEPHLLIIRTEQIQIAEAPTRSQKIVFLADPQLGPYKGERFLQRVVNLTLEQQPDLVILGGDYIYKQAVEDKEFSPLSELTEKVPVYAVMGNHDYHLYSSQAPVDQELGATVRQQLESLGIRVLINEGEYQNDLFIAGVDDYWSRNVDLDTALATRVFPTEPTILIAHNPDMLLDILPEQGINLMLSGHTHGGQIRLPLIGPVGQIPNILGQKYDQGLFQEKNMQLYITSGLGESGPRARLFNQPEIVILEVSY